MKRVTKEQYEERCFEEARQAYADMDSTRKMLLDAWLKTHISPRGMWNVLLSDEVREYAGIEVVREEVDGALMAAGYKPSLYLQIQFKIAIKP